MSDRIVSLIPSDTEILDALGLVEIFHPHQVEKPVHRGTARKPIHA